MKCEDTSKSLEVEYIKSLQQQIYLLELENTYVRQQADEAKSVQSKLPTEVAELKAKLKEEKTLSEGLRQELTLSEQKVATLMQKQLELSERVHKTEEEKEAFAARLLQATAEKNELAREKVRQSTQIEDLRLELYRHQVALSATATQMQSLRAQAIFDNSRLLLAENPPAQQVQNLSHWQPGQVPESPLGIFLFNRYSITSREGELAHKGTRGSPQESDSQEKHLESQFYRQSEDERQLNDVQEQVRAQAREIDEMKKFLTLQMSSQSKTPERMYVQLKSVVSKSVQTTVKTQNEELTAQISEIPAGSHQSSPHSQSETPRPGNEADEEVARFDIMGGSLECVLTTTGEEEWITSSAMCTVADVSPSGAGPS
ncbi:unnamed protein product [Schistocephalus solidus]|uniref:Shootin-1 n=1 Tax=Schistocephalus solidus TaxID=70667 RepID=A0A183SN62_SCHSO|nr:unnamed protein product [Schistocephalus solidus]